MLSILKNNGRVEDKENHVTIDKLEVYIEVHKPNLRHLYTYSMLVTKVLETIIAVMILNNAYSNCIEIN